MFSRVGSHDHGLPFQSGFSSDFDGGIEGVHVDVEDDAGAGGGRRSHTVSEWPADELKGFSETGANRSVKTQRTPEPRRSGTRARTPRDRREHDESEGDKDGRFRIDRGP